jgi:hypothetical protein
MSIMAFIKVERILHFGGRKKQLGDRANDGVLMSDLPLSICLSN